MNIYDFAMSIPRAFISTFFKMPRIQLDEIGKQEILKNGLYHITPNEDITNKILECEYLKPTNAICSYGKSSVFLFNGTPDVENYMKNLTDTNNANNPYLNPAMVVSAVKIQPKEYKELSNYKVRGLSDDVMIYEGYCVLPKNEVQAVFLVPDLVRDDKTGKPVINPKTQKYDIKFREAEEYELDENKKNYKPKEDYIKFIEQEREKLGYKTEKGFIKNTFNSINAYVHEAKIEEKMILKNITHIPDIIKRKIKQILTPKLDMSTDEKVDTLMDKYNYKKKNPYRDEKFGKVVADFQTKGLEQLNLKQELEELTTSENGKYFREKYNQLNKYNIKNKGTDKINHSNRVAMYTMIIAQKEGILEKDVNNKTKDILLSSVYYHNIGRKMRKEDLSYANGRQYSDNDKRIIKAIINVHDSKDKNIEKVCKKYKIENIEYVTDLIKIIKDAELLDKTRLDKNTTLKMKTKLNPEHLKTNTAKQLLNLSYEFEELSKKVPFERILAYKTEYQKEINKSSAQIKRDEFINGLKKDISKSPEKIKKTLQLKKEKILSKYSGNKITCEKEKQEIQER